MTNKRHKQLWSRKMTNKWHKYNHKPFEPWLYLRPIGTIGWCLVIPHFINLDFQIKQMPFVQLKRVVVCRCEWKRKKWLDKVPHVFFFFFFLLLLLLLLLLSNTCRLNRIGRYIALHPVLKKCLYNPTKQNKFFNNFFIHCILNVYLSFLIPIFSSELNFYLG